MLIGRLQAWSLLAADFTQFGLHNGLYTKLYQYWIQTFPICRTRLSAQAKPMYTLKASPAIAGFRGVWLADSDLQRV
jgi:hypothetical protein